MRSKVKVSSLYAEKLREKKSRVGVKEAGRRFQSLLEGGNMLFIW